MKNNHFKKSTHRNQWIKLKKKPKKLFSKQYRKFIEKELSNVY